MNTWISRTSKERCAGRLHSPHQPAQLIRRKANRGNSPLLFSTLVHGSERISRQPDESIRYPRTSKSIVVKHRSGRVALSQIIESYKTSEGDLEVAEVAFVAEKVPSLGYDTYYLVFGTRDEPGADTDLKVDEQKFALENNHLRIRIGPGPRRNCQPDR